MAKLDPDKIAAEVAQWKPQYQEEFAQQLRSAQGYLPFYCPYPACDGFPHVRAVDNPNPCDYPYADGAHPWDPDNQWVCIGCGAMGVPEARGKAVKGQWLHHHARSDQRPPRWSDDWRVNLWLSGRSAGKTYGASKLVHQWVNRVPRIALIGMTGPTIRRDMVEGPSGILATASPDNVPLWEPSKQEITWANGAKGYIVSAEEPQRIRGLNTAGVWMDEPAHYAYVDEVWTQIRLALRDKGLSIKTLATTTPKPIPWLKKLVKDKKTIVRKVSTYRNLHNLNADFRDVLLDQFEGTRIGRQELHGELLDDNTGALFIAENFQYAGIPAPNRVPTEVPSNFPTRVPTRDELVRVGIGVDPAGSTNARADETGIVVGGVDKDGWIWALEDATGKYTPNGWANKVQQLSDKWHADVVVAERNYGGQMVEAMLRQVDLFTRIVTVHSRKGKALRAEPIAGLYEQFKIIHARGMAKFEAELTDWVPGIGASPNALDAWVHLAHDLHKNASRRPVEISSPLDVQWGSDDDAGIVNQLFGMGSEETIPANFSHVF